MQRTYCTLVYSVCVFQCLVHVPDMQKPDIYRCICSWLDRLGCYMNVQIIFGDNVSRGTKLLDSWCRNYLA